MASVAAAKGMFTRPGSASSRESALMDRLRAADPQPVFQHLLANAVYSLSGSDEVLQHYMIGRLIRHQQGAGEEVRLGLCAAVASTLAGGG